MSKKYIIDIEKWKQNGLQGQWGPLWPTEDCDYETLAEANWELQKCDTTEEVGQLHQSDFDIDALGGNFYAEYQELVRPFWMELANLELFRQLDYTFRVWSDPWDHVFMKVRFEETNRADAEGHTELQSPLSAAESIIDYWLRHHIDAFQTLENGFSWRCEPENDKYTRSYRVTVANDWVYFCIKQNAIFYGPTSGHAADVCAVPLETINKILSYLPGAEAEHRKQRRNLLTQHNWNYSIFACQHNFYAPVTLGVRFENSIEEPIRCRVGTSTWENYSTHHLYELVICDLGSLENPKEQQFIPLYSYESVKYQDGWAEVWGAFDETSIFKYCLPYNVFMDILRDMRKIIDTSELKLEDPSQRPVLSRRIYPRESSIPNKQKRPKPYKVQTLLPGNHALLDLSEFLSKDTAASAGEVRGHRSTKDWKQNCLSGKRWPPP